MQNETKRISSGSPWETTSGYVRAVAGRDLICVSATAATDADGQVMCRGDMEGQTAVILEKMAAVLAQAGAGLGDVLQTRLYLTDITRAAEAGRAHARAFADTPPALSLIHVLPFVDPGMLIEIELIAERPR
ncbi:RidA family protein [Pseudooceanicola sp. GBMRC 2024]|uniref:RidA family protein n=1 Tax=Pseudooceanicola albus TaxID=2692189 RepID=A0A6L7G363_9RHOB|nr:RidA family protein [Pseudooceanicola albus]MXN17907.1 RidA family protein [Pseudooceanicola albus]